MARTGETIFYNIVARNKARSVSAGAGGGGTAKNALKGIIAGGMAGGLEITMTYPTEYVKTQLQLDEKGVNKKYAGAMDCVKKTINERGILGLYRGLSILVLGSIPKSAIRFGSFEFITNHLKKEDGTMPLSYRFVAGLFAGTMESILAVTPMETIKVKLINDMRSPNPQYRGLIHGVGQIVKQEGIGGIYKGLAATILRQGSNQAVRFYVMYYLREWYTGNDPGVSVPKVMTPLFGFVAGACSVFANNPVDVVKTRMQGLEAQKYKGTLDCMFQILRKEGPFAFYKGIGPRLGRVCLDASITFTLYDIFMDLINSVWH